MNERMAKMRRYRDMIGGLRASLLLGVSTAALLTGCDMFDGNTPVSSRQVRPGAERSVAVSNSLPAAGTGRQYDTGITAVDETRGGTQIGSIVAGKGGQKAQQEEQAKAQRDTDRKARTETERQIAQRKAEDALAAGAPPPPAASTASSTAVAAPPPAPVTTTAIAPPTETAAATPSTPSAQIATPPAPEPMVVATAPVRPTDPNKAFEPPPGWVPPGQTAPMATASTAPATAIATAPPPATIAAPPPAATATTSTTLLPPPTETAAAAPQPAPVVVAAPARRVDPNKAFEPPPGWAPPGQAAPVAPAAAPPPPAMASAPAPSGSTTMTTATTLLPPAQVASAAPPSPITQPPAYEPTPMTQVRSATPRVGAGESAMPSSPADRPGFARPGDVAVAAAAPLPVTVTPIPEPAASPPTSPAVTVTATPTAPPVNLQADIAHAQSGAVPASAIKFPPGGPLQVGVIQFGRASSGLGGRDGDILKKIAQIQKKNGGTERVVAHTEQDVTGSSVGQIEQGNYDVSRRRAINIANQLMALGVPRSAIVAEAASDSEPKYATNTARGIAANRRAEIFLDL